MKRLRERAPLGASEFAAILNGDNATAILTALQTFVRTVRREKREALLEPTEKNQDKQGSSDQIQGKGDFFGGLSDDDNDDDDGDDDEENIEEDEGEGNNVRGDDGVPSKKFKKIEAWKEDSVGWGNEFVGTSVAKGDRGTVVKGEWPTGLIKAYLLKSPLAIELTSSQLIPSSPDATVHKQLIRRHRGILSRAIYRAYLNALTELVMAAIPPKRLQNLITRVGDVELATRSEWGTDDVSPLALRFLPELMNERLQDMFALLRDETNNGKSKLGASNNLRPLSQYAIRVLKYAACTTTTNARLVAENLHSRLPDGALAALLKPTRKVQPPAEKVEQHAGEEKVVKETKAQKCVSAIQAARVEALGLASTLASIADTAIDAYITTPGSRERKVKPGIFHLALHDGMKTIDSGVEQKEYYLAVKILLHTLEYRYCEEKASMVTTKSTCDMLSQDILTTLSTLATLAPTSRTANTIEDLLDSSYQLMTTAVDLSTVAAMQLLVLLLVDKQRSPLLRQIDAKRDPFRSKHQEEQITRVLYQLYQNSNAGRGFQQVLLQVLSSSPRLFGSFCQGLSFPNTKYKYSFISHLNFITSVIGSGPCPTVCFDAKYHDSLDNTMAGVDNVVSTLIPAKFHRQHLNKVLQTRDPLLTSNCLRFMIVVLGRYQQYLSAVDSLDKGREEEVRKALLDRLPELAQLLLMRSKYEVGPVKESAKEMIIVDQLHLAVDAYMRILPSCLDDINFDWVKLLPSTALDFHKLPRLVQRRTLATILLALQTNGTLEGSSRLLQIALHILTTTTSRMIYKRSKQLALLLLMPLFLGQDSNPDTIEHLSFEASCWIDSLTEETVDEFCKRVNSSSRNRSVYIWGATLSIKSLLLGSSSPLLMSILSNGSDYHGSISPQTISFIIKRCILFCTNPIPLAEIITASSSSLNLDMNLKEYADLLLESNSASFPCKETSRKAAHTIHTFFDGKNRIQKLLNSVLAIESPKIDLEESMQTLLQLSYSDLIAVLRSIIHVVKISPYHLDLSTFGTMLSIMTCICVRLAATNAGGTTAATGTLTALHSLRMVDSYAENVRVRLLLGSSPLASSAMSPKATTTAHSSKSPMHRNAMHHFTSAVILENLSFESAVDFKINFSKMMMTSNNPDFGKLASIVFQGHPINTKAMTQLGHGVVHSLFEVWSMLANHDNSLANGLAACLVYLLREVLSETGSDSAFLMARITRESPETVFRWFANCMSRSKGAIDNDACHLIRVIAEYDHDFWCGMVSTDQQMDEPGSNNQLDRSKRALLHFHISLINGNSIASGRSHSHGQALEYFSSEILTKLQDTKPNQVIIVRDLLGKISPEQEVPKNVLGNFSTIFIELNRTVVDPLKIETEVELIRVASLALYKSATGSSHKANMEDVAPAVLSRVCTLFLALRKLKSRFDEKATKKYKMDLMASLCELIEIFASQKIQLIKSEQEDEALFQLVRRALKDGVVGTSDVDTALPQLHLKFIWELLSTLAQSGHNWREHKIPAPAQIFEMVTSHSQFEAALQNQTCNNYISDLLKLLYVCYTFATPEKPAMNEDTWRILSSGFQAGLNEYDMLFRKLYSEYCLSAAKTNSEPYLDQIRWKRADHSGSAEITPWSWLPEAFDLSRIHRTIEHFPEDDSAIVANEDGITDDEDVIEIAATSEQPSSLLSSKKPATNQDQRQRKSNEARYSPGFLLPLILASLEYYDVFAQPIWEDSMDEVAQFEISKHAKQLAQFVQRLCEKGALSLVLASLCSKCQIVRKLSLAILAMITTVCQSNEAGKLTTWRQRPQIALLLNSLQRALTLQKAHAKDAMSDEADTLPRLPGIVVVFFAKAYFILSKPEDPMFGPINRYFLKSLADHGACQDLNRVPGFMAFFCSASEDPTQAYNERVWALNLLEFGCLDRHCYTLIAACHAPELIMTHTENILRKAQEASHLREKELASIFHTLSSMIARGQTRATSHLISKMGLVSWLRCVLLSPSEIFLSTRVLKSFLGLVEESSIGASNYHHQDSNSSTISLLELVNLTICLIKFAHNIDTVRALLDGNLRLRFVEALATLGESMSRLKDDKFKRSIDHHDGVDGESLSWLLAKCPTSHFESILATISFVSLKTMDVSESCKLVILLMKHTSQVADNNNTADSQVNTAASSSSSSSLVEACLQTVDEIVGMNGSTLKIGERLEILESLLLWYKQLTVTVASRKVWLNCLKVIAKTFDGADDGDDDDDGKQLVMLARRLIENSSASSNGAAQPMEQ